MKGLFPITLLLVAISSSICLKSLPENVFPILYNLTLQIRPTATSFLGNLTMTVNVTKSTNRIQLRIDKNYLYVRNITRLETNGTISQCKLYHQSSNEQIFVCSTFEVGVHTVQLRYEGWYRDKGIGLFRSNYTDKGVNETMFLTNVFPVYASLILPCYDEPKFKAKFDITIIHPDDYTAIGNTPIESQLPGPEQNEVQTKFVTTPKMPTHSLVLIITRIGKFVSSDKLKSEDVQYNMNVSPKFVDALQVCFNLQASVDMIDTMGKFVNISYTDLGLNTMTMVAVPNNPVKTSSSWGTIFFDESYLLDEKPSITAENVQDIVRTTANAITSHWFGQFVTVNWWNDVWIEYGIATYFEFFLPDMVDDLNFQLMDQFVCNILQVALEEDSYYSVPLATTVNNVQGNLEILRKLEPITALKGASMIHMIRNYVNDTYFQRGLQQLIAENPYGLSTSTKFCTVLNICDFINKYINEAGYPLVTVTLRDNGTVGTKQNVFSLIQRNITSDVEWSIPLQFLSISTQGIVENKALQIGEKLPETIEIESDSWIILNTNQTSYYRVNYDPVLWQRIIAAIKNPDMGGIPVINRAGLLDDIFNIARVGMVDYKLVFNLAEYLKGETEYSPWLVYFRGISYMLDHLNDTEVIELLKEISRQWLNEAFPEMNHNVDDSHLNVLRDTFINEWKCTLNDANCILYAIKTYHTFKNTPLQPSLSNNNERYLIFCNALISSGEEESDYDFLWEQVKRTNMSYVRRKYLQSLGCAPNKDTQIKLLSELLHEGNLMDKSDANVIINAILENRNNGVDSIISFLEENLEQLAESYEGYIDIQKLILSLSRKLSDESKLEGLITLANSTGRINAYDLIYEQTTGFMNMNKIWDETYSESIKTALQQFTPQNSAHVVLKNKNFENF